MNHLPRILETHKAHPEWCSKEIALALDISWGHVRKIAELKQLKFPSSIERRRVRPELGHLKPKP